MSVAENLTRVQERIAAAAHQAGRKPNEIKLVAVSKTFPVELIAEAYRAGAREIGENRLEEASVKIPAVNAVVGAQNVRWHLIGHLQRRKARDAVALFDVVQSVDTAQLAEKINRVAREQNKRAEVLLQVNIAKDPHKFGFELEPRLTLLKAIENIITLPQLRVQGLMTIGPLVASAEEARPFFRALRLLRDELAARFPQAEWRELSMGMTDDYAVAIAEGATIVRIGRAIFGQRENVR